MERNLEKEDSDTQPVKKQKSNMEIIIDYLKSRKALK